MIRHEIQLPVYKQGDDLDACLQRHDGNVTRALLKQADLYRDAAFALEQLACHRRADELEISADTHSITVDGPDDVLEELVKRELIRRVEDAPVAAVFEKRRDGWHYHDANYPEEGSVGPFKTRKAAVAHAAEGGYVVDKKEKKS